MVSKTSKHHPLGLENWVAQLDSSELPVLPHKLLQLRECLAQKEFVLSDVSAIVSSDPIMTLHLLREANRQFKQDDKWGKPVALGSLTNVHHCVALLGESRVRTLVRDFDGAQSNSQGSLYQASAIKTLHAKSQLVAWHGIRSQAGVEKNSVAALAAGLPECSMWHFAPREMAVIRELMSERVTPEYAERLVLGCSFAELALALATRWHLPEVVLEVLREKPFPDTYVLGRSLYKSRGLPKPSLPNKDSKGNLVKSPAFIVGLSHWLAREAARDWYSTDTDRITHLIAAYLERNVDTTRTFLHQNAIAFSKGHKASSVPVPASSLINLNPGFEVDRPPLKPLARREWPLSEAEERVATLLKPLDSREQAKPSASTTTGFRGIAQQQRFRSWIGNRQWQTELRSLLLPKQQLDFYAKLEQAMQILYETVSVGRVTVLTFENDQGVVTHAHHQPNQVSLHSCYGWDGVGLEMALESDNFFTQLAQRPASLWIKPSVTLPEAAQMPERFRDWFQRDEFYVISLQRTSVPFALVLVDNGDKPITQLQVSLIKAVVNRVNQGLQATRNAGALPPELTRRSATRKPGAPVLDTH